MATKDQMDFFRKAPAKPKTITRWEEMEWIRTDQPSKIIDALLVRQAAGEIVFPHLPKIFTAMELTPLSNVRVVILGQDPYHTPGKAMGLAFSVPKGVGHPPSLQNIFKELESDLGCDYPQHGDLSSWANQGVLLLNTILTVSQGNPMSHSSLGWEGLTTEMIRTVIEFRREVMFLLWGNYAMSSFNQANQFEDKSMFDNNGHAWIHTPHPSPMSAHSGFFGSRPFSRTNKFLSDRKKPSINWCISA